jgi:hypothetical protein
VRGAQPVERSRIARPMRTLLLYLAAGVSYTVLGIYNQNFLYSFFEGLAFLCGFVVGIPWVVDRVRLRLRK